jgi:coenzyme F420 hydrogenase subunit beta
MSIKNIHDIVREGLCIGCGICQSIAGKNNVKMSMSNEGFYYPKVIEKSSSELFWSEIREACPGLCIKQAWRAANKTEMLWGPVRGCFVGHSTEENLRYIASSGGTISGLLCFLLETKQVTGVVHVRRSASDPTLNETVLSRNSTEIVQAAGSRYAPVSPLISIKNILRQDGERFVFVGRPCDVSGLQSYLKMYPEWKDKIAIMISFFCAGTPSYTATTEVLTALGANDIGLKDFWYRGHGWPGKTTAICFDGSDRNMDYENSWGKILGKRLHFRCKICPDGIGIAADIVCADAWHENNGGPSFEESPGRSLIIARTTKGEETLNDAVDAKYIRMNPYKIISLEQIQQYQFARRRNVGARILAFRAAGKMYPKYVGMYLWRNLLRAGIKENIGNFLGMFRRIRNRIKTGYE